ncbi:squalene synthetase-like protein [Saitoella coloradoensis]
MGKKGQQNGKGKGKEPKRNNKLMGFVPQRFGGFAEDDGTQVRGFKMKDTGRRTEHYRFRKNGDDSGEGVALRKMGVSFVKSTSGGLDPDAEINDAIEEHEVDTTADAAIHHAEDLRHQHEHPVANHVDQAMEEDDEDEEEEDDLEEEEEDAEEDEEEEEEEDEEDDINNIPMVPPREDDDEFNYGASDSDAADEQVARAILASGHDPNTHVHVEQTTLTHLSVEDPGEGSSRAINLASLAIEDTSVQMEVENDALFVVDMEGDTAMRPAEPSKVSIPVRYEHAPQSDEEVVFVPRRGVRIVDETVTAAKIEHLTVKKTQIDVDVEMRDESANWQPVPKTKPGKVRGGKRARGRKEKLNGPGPGMRDPAIDAALDDYMDNLANQDFDSEEEEAFEHRGHEFAALADRGAGLEDEWVDESEDEEEGEVSRVGGVGLGYYVGEESSEEDDEDESSGQEDEDDDEEDEDELDHVDIDDLLDEADDDLEGIGAEELEELDELEQLELAIARSLGNVSGKGLLGKKNKRGKDTFVEDALFNGDFHASDFEYEFEDDGDDIGGFEPSKSLKAQLKRAGKRLPARIEDYELGLSDEDMEAQIKDQWAKDRSSKADKKREREELRKAGMLGKGKKGKKAKLADRDEFSLGISIQRINIEIRDFIDDLGMQSLPLPPMDRFSRRTVHTLASAYNLKSKSVGTGKRRAPTLIKTMKTSYPRDERLVDEILARHDGGGRGNTGYLPRLDRPRPRPGKTVGQRGGVSGLVRNNNGSVVGGDAPEIGAGNLGRKLLEKMGWSSGQGLGVEGRTGISVPVMAVVKTDKRGL